MKEQNNNEEQRKVESKSPTNGKEVKIPPQTNLNELDDSYDSKQIKDEDQKKRKFPDTVFDKLPPSIKAFIEIFIDQEEREIVLVAFLGAISTIICNCVGKYNGKSAWANLYSFIIGPFGSGKGIATFPQRLLYPIHDQMRAEVELAKEGYQKEIDEYEKQMAMYKKGEIDSAPDKPKKPSDRMLFVPGNITKPALMKKLNDNPLGICIFECEGDTVADSQKTQHGNYSDILRKGFQNEPSTSGKLKDDEQIEVKKTNLTAVLLMTLDQLSKFMGSIANGLFSRALYYWVPMSYEFQDVFDDRKENYEEKVDAYAENFSKLYQTLEARPIDQPVVFQLTKLQKKIFLKTFQELKIDFIENVSEDSAGIIHRLALMAFKIAMIFSVIRNYDADTLGDVISCTDEDFDNAMLIVLTLRTHTLYILNKMPKPNLETLGIGKEEKLKDELELRQQARRLKDEGKSYREIAIILLGSAKKKSNIFRWLN